MAKLEQYRSYIEQLIKAHSHYQPSFGEVEVQLIFDREHDHYQLVNLGWHGPKRIRGCVLHIDLKGEKIWIQHDGTEVGIADELVSLGVPKEDIVLAFHARSRRPYTGFAVG